MCKCGTERESCKHFFLDCPLYVEARRDLLSTINDLSQDKANIGNHVELLDVILYGSNKLNERSNKLILEASIGFILRTKRFKRIEAYIEKEAMFGA